MRKSSLLSFFVTLKPDQPIPSYAEAKNLLDEFYMNKKFEPIASKLQENKYSDEEIKHARQLLEQPRDETDDQINLLLYQLVCKK